MSHISTGVEYALHSMLILSRTAEGESGPSAKDLAELQCIPAEYVAKLFTKLNKAGLVRATEGVRGGFTLAHRPDAISVLAVVDAIDGQKALFDCREIRQTCALFEDKTPGWAKAGRCSIHAVMISAEQRMRESLAEHTLADLNSRVDLKTPASHTVSIVNWLDQRTANRRPGRT